MFISIRPFNQEKNPPAEIGEPPCKMPPKEYLDKAHKIIKDHNGTRTNQD